MKDTTALVTGGAGFLGSHFIRYALDHGASRVINLDLLTYAGDLRRLADLQDDSRLKFVRADVGDREEVANLLKQERPQLIVHYAAESHVTRGESGPEVFYRSNVEGTRVLLEAAVDAGVQRFVHISTDEVYGPILSGSYREEDKQPGDAQASSDYARSKSLGDDLARSFADSLRVIVARPTNAFGPFQFPEKAFARWVTRALQDEPLPVWGDGLYVRQWLFCEDFAEAIGLLAKRGEPGEVYNVGPTHDPEITNLALVEWLVEHLGVPADRLTLTDYDRPDHDRRYAIDSSKITNLGWRPGDVWSQFTRTVEWFRANEDWWTQHIAEAESIYTDSAS